MRSGCCTLKALNQAPGQGSCSVWGSCMRLSPARMGLPCLGGSRRMRLLTACSKILPLLSTLKVEMPSKMPSASHGTLGTPWTVHRILRIHITCSNLPFHNQRLHLHNHIPRHYFLTPLSLHPCLTSVVAWPPQNFSPPQEYASHLQSN